MSLPSLHRTRRGGTLVALAVGAMVGLTLVSGCSDSPKSANVTGLKMIPSSAAHDLLVKAKNAVAGNETAHIKGLVVAGGSEMTIDLSAGAAAGAGTAEVDGFTAEVRVVNGELYVKGGADFWDALKKGVGAGFGDTWIKTSARTGAQFAALLELVPASSALDRLAPSTSAWTEVPGRTLDGADTLGVKEAQSGRGNTVYIARTAPGRPLAVELAKGGLLTFSDWGKAIKNVTVPQGEVLDASDATLAGAVLPSN